MNSISKQFKTVAASLDDDDDELSVRPLITNRTQESVNKIQQICYRTKLRNVRITDELDGNK